MGAPSGKSIWVNKAIREKVSAHEAGEGQNERGKAKCSLAGLGAHSRCLDNKQALVDDFMASLQWNEGMLQMEVN